MDKEPKSKSAKYGEYLQGQFISTPLYQNKLLKNIAVKGPGPRITWKGKGKGRQEREMMAMKTKGEKMKGEKKKKKGEKKRKGKKAKEEDGEGVEEVLIEEEKEEITMEAKKHKYVRTCIEFKLNKKRIKREERMKEEMDRVKEEMAMREARQPFPTLDMSAEV